MTRAPLVLAGTALGLGGILGYHISAGPSASLAPASSAGTPTTQTTTATQTTSASSTKATTTSSATSSAAKTRSATGTDVGYMYGDLELKVAVTGTKVTAVSVARLNVTDPRSQQIDDAAIPQLHQEALAAGSAKIDGVSGASYTSQAYEQSLQSALDKLGVSSSSA